MGCRFNVFFADKYDAEVNRMQLSDGDKFTSCMDRVLTSAIQECVKKAEVGWQEEREECLADGEDIDVSAAFEFEGYSGDIASGERKLVYVSDEFTVAASEEGLLQDGNDRLQFPCDHAWFDPIRSLLQQRCQKFGPSMCVRINGRWAIMGYYGD
jgi:hypothetical protein